MPTAAEQFSFDELGTPLREVTFVVVDLETTGGAPATDAITEIGAVKVRGGEVLGEFATLVHPGRGVPPSVVALTGITGAMLTPAPPISTVLPGFLEFATGAVLVAHNAAFDTAFLRAASQRHGVPWSRPAVLCTARLARRATVDVLHLEAQVRELRLLAAHRPRYNRRSKAPDRVWWVTLTEEAFPRLSVVRAAGGAAAAHGGGAAGRRRDGTARAGPAAWCACRGGGRGAQLVGAIGHPAGAYRAAVE